MIKGWLSTSIVKGKKVSGTFWLSNRGLGCLFPQVFLKRISPATKHQMVQVSQWYHFTSWPILLTTCIILLLDSNIQCFMTIHVATSFYFICILDQSLMISWRENSWNPEIYLVCLSVCLSVNKLQSTLFYLGT